MRSPGRCSPETDCASRTFATRGSPRARGASGFHLFGTDQLGFDLSVRLAETLRISLVVALCTTAAATAIGVAVGAVAALTGGCVDALLMRATDLVASLPHLLTTLVVVAMFRGSRCAARSSSPSPPRTCPARRQAPTT